jgi:dihydropteroate synthase
MRLITVPPRQPEKPHTNGGIEMAIYKVTNAFHAPGTDVVDIKGFVKRPGETFAQSEIIPAGAVIKMDAKKYASGIAKLMDPTRTRICIRERSETALDADEITADTPRASIMKMAKNELADIVMDIDPAGDKYDPTVNKPELVHIICEHFGIASDGPPDPPKK